ncbi:MAG: hypothetical protein ACRDKT_11885 [Actinomycetota bacterium]
MNDEQRAGTAGVAVPLRTILLGVALAVIVGLVVAASVSTPNDTADTADTADQPDQEAAPDLVAEIESALKNAATAEESYLTTHSRYTERIEDLQAEGLLVPPNIQILVQARGGRGYCIMAGTAQVVLHYDSDTGAPAQGPCPPGG